MRYVNEGATTVHVVDDDLTLNESTCVLLQALGYRPVSWPSGDLFLARVDVHEPACVILDLRMPGTDGIEVLQQMQTCDHSLCFVVATGHGDVATAVAALKLGAADFLEKPYLSEKLVRALGGAQAQLQAKVAKFGQAAARAAIARLTPRECQILDGLINGGTNKSLASRLSLSPRTVEMHRANLMDKLAARTLGDLLATAYRAGLTPSDAASRAA